ncbi:MAG: hydrolase [Candidatus Bathyarchaeia archaeon]
MPFTPFHLGPGLGFGLPMRKYLHAPTFILANVIVDVEPFLVLFFGLRYPLHGYLHTFLLAIPVGLVFGYIMFLLERFLHPLYKIFLLETSNCLSLKSFVVAGMFGTGLHVLLDAPLYHEITPFYPVTANPFYNPALTLEIYSLCIWMGGFGIIYYIGILGLTIYRKLSKESNIKYVLLREAKRICIYTSAKYFSYSLTRNFLPL